MHDDEEDDDFDPPYQAYWGQSFTSDEHRREVSALLDGAPADAERLFWWLHKQPGQAASLDRDNRLDLHRKTGISDLRVEAAVGHLQRAGAADVSIDHKANALRVRLLDREERIVARARQRRDNGHRDPKPGL